MLGAAKKQLIAQFMTETVGTTIIAGIIAIGFAQLGLPKLNAWFDKAIPTSALFSMESLVFIGGIILGTSLIAGFFPSWILTKFKPIAVLRSALKLAPGGETPRQILTTLQLAVSVGLIAGTFMLHRQFNYILNKDLGFDKEQVLVMDTPEGVLENVEAFKNELLALPGVTSVSMCNAAIGDGTFGVNGYT